MKQFYALILAALSLSAAATNHQVQVGSNFFSPAYLSVSPGDTVTWNQVSGTHNVNGSQSIFSSNPVSFGNGSPAGGTWTYSFVFSTPGVYTYQCDPHASMMIGIVNLLVSFSLALWMAMRARAIARDDVRGLGDALGRRLITSPSLFFTSRGLPPDVPPDVPTDAPPSSGPRQAS